MHDLNNQPMDEQPPRIWVCEERSYDQRAKAIIAFNTCKGDLDDKLEAAWLATIRAHLSPSPSDPSCRVDELERVKEMKPKAEVSGNDVDVTIVRQGNFPEGWK